MSEESVTDAPSDSQPDTILVLGASSDIGLELIRQLVPQRPRILAHYNQSDAKLESLKHELPESTIHLLRADLSRPDDTDALVAAIQQLQPLPNKVIHLPAPALEYIRFKDVRWENFQRYFDVQLRSLIAVLQVVLPEMARRKQGKIVAVLSSCTLAVPPGAMSQYVTAKYALLGLVRALAAEYSSRRLNINAVSPSMVETAFLKNIDDRMVEIAASQTPFQRNASRQDVAGTIRFLLSAESDYITGANIPVSGGSAF